MKCPVKAKKDSVPFDVQVSIVSVRCTTAPNYVLITATKFSYSVVSNDLDSVDLDGNGTYVGLRPREKFRNLKNGNNG